MSGLDPCIALRTEGRDQFAKTGLPSRKREDWHYTDLSQSDVAGFAMAEEALPVKAGEGQIIVVNGFLNSCGALPDGVRFESIEAQGLGQDIVGTILPVKDLPLVALNAQLFAQALVLRVKAGVTVAAPLTLLLRSIGSEQGLQQHGRLLLLLEEGASLTILERHEGENRTFSNFVMEAQLQRGAKLRHVVLQNESKSATHIATLGVDLAENAVYQGVTLHLGGHLVRREIHAYLKGPHADFALDTASLVQGGQHIDNTTRVIHRAPRCLSRQLFKTVLDQDGHGVFQGTVLVERPAQKTAAHQLSRALMLSDRAAMDNKPELEIFADDVKCGHGATIGDLDADALFYLRGRGIPEAAARRMLTEAFLRDVLERIDNEATLVTLTTLLQERLQGLTEGVAA